MQLWMVIQCYFINGDNLSHKKKEETNKNIYERKEKIQRGKVLSIIKLIGIEYNSKKKKN